MQDDQATTTAITAINESYNCCIQSGNTLYIEPNFLSKGFFINPGLPSMDFFIVVALQPHERPKQVNWFWSTTGKLQPTTFIKLAPYNGQENWLSTKPRNESAHSCLSACPTVLSTHDSKSHSLEYSAAW